MVDCSECSSKAVFASGRAFCSVHFVEYFEGKVLWTIRKFDLVGKRDRVVVGSSGGKDSTAVLYVVKKYFGRVEALAIDEGIPGYRNVTLEDLRRFCSSHDVPLKVCSYSDEFGFSLADALKASGKLKPCYVCGVLRRYLLNLKAKGYDKIATGHNLDDEAQSIMMNLVKAQLPLLSRLGPKSLSVGSEGFVPRVKPLYFCTEREVAAYVLIKKLGSRFSQCPHSMKSFRAFVRDLLNDYEVKNRGSKVRLVNNFLEFLPDLKSRGFGGGLKWCGVCGEPSSNRLCKACTLVRDLAPAVESMKREK